VSDAAGDAKYVGYVKKAGAASGASIMRAFLNGGFLGSEDMGLDVRVVSRSTTAPSITFQWKTNQQKVRWPADRRVILPARAKR
jgi:hypothetical protein